MRGYFECPFTSRVTFRLYRDLSVNSTWLNHVAPNLESPSSSGRTVAWGQRNADHYPTCISPPSCSRFCTVWLDTLHPVAENCLCSCVAFSVLFQRAVNCIYRSSVDVVARGRPAPGRRLTFPVSCDRFHSLATTLLATPTASANVVFAGFQSAYNTPCHGFRTATAGSDGVQSGRPNFDDFFKTFVAIYRQ
ncbi:hypothetical protein TNCV_3618041 [Trichonephila clavipes]|nr:hypothetical protein TNCV_3618041 [Trichonephila clavipes]